MLEHLFSQRIAIAAAATTTAALSEPENNHHTRMNSHGFESTQSNNLQRPEQVQKACSSTLSESIFKDLAKIPDDQFDHMIIVDKSCIATY